MKTYVVEKSRNAHVLKSERKINAVVIDTNTIDITLNGNSIVTHGEHGTLKIESQRVIKYVQQELNPITKKLQNAFD